MVAVVANGQTAEVAVLQSLGRMEERMGRLEEQQALLLQLQEGHYKDVEELGDTVEQAVEEGTSLLDGLEESSRQARTTAENVLATANAAKNIAFALLAIGGLGLVLWMLYWKARAHAASLRQPGRAPVDAPATVPVDEAATTTLEAPKAKSGIRNMD